MGLFSAANTLPLDQLLLRVGPSLGGGLYAACCFEKIQYHTSLSLIDYALSCVFCGM